MAKERVVVIAGKRHTLRYDLEDAVDIEAQAPGRTLGQMIAQGTMLERAAIVWGGLKHGDDKLTPRQVVKLLGEHRDSGGEWDRDVYLPCVRALMENRLLGSYNDREIEDLMAKIEGKGPGKDAAAPA